MQRAWIFFVACLASCGGSGTTDTGPGQDVVDVPVADVPPVDNGPPPDVRHDLCVHANTCDTCSPTAGCGWCLTEMRCVPGNSGGSTDGVCTGTDWAFVPTDCHPGVDGGSDVGADGGG